MVSKDRCVTPHRHFHPETRKDFLVTDKIKAMLLHLGHNMWCEWLPDDVMPKAEIRPRYIPDYEIRNRDEHWYRVTNYMAVRKLNMVVIDIGEGLVYPSHPKLAIKGSWTPDRLRDEVLRLRGMGIEAIPKLNFSRPMTVGSSTTTGC